MFKNTLDRAGLTVVEGSKLLGISRPTFYNWEKGVKPRVQIQYRAAAHAIKLIEKAIDAGRLPLVDVSLTASERIAIIKSIMKLMSTS